MSDCDTDDRATGRLRWTLANLLVGLSLAVVAPTWAAVDEPELPDEEDIHPPGELATPFEEEPSLADQLELSPVVQRLLDDDLTHDEEKTELRIFHGQWDELDEDELTVAQRARLALLRYELEHPSLADEEADPLVRAEAALERGEPGEVHALLPEVDSHQAAMLRARAYEQQGQLGAAVNTLKDWQEELEQRGEPGAVPEGMAPAPELTARARNLVLLARWEGRPARDYQQAMNLLGEVRNTHDPLYWPAHVMEAELLREKDNNPDAGQALEEALTLNPRSSRAWYHLGRLTGRGFNFDAADEAMQQLREVNDQHLLADLLEAHVRLVQRDPESAQQTLNQALSRYPRNRELNALKVAAKALAYEEEATERAIEAYDELAPGDPLAHLLAGEYLSLARQYEVAERMLREAMERQPNATAPRIDLGLLLMQAAKDEEAARQLRQATRMDPFNRRAANSLMLVEELLEYGRLDTENFIITFRPGVDEVLARDMARELETIHADITQVFQHEPLRRTQVDILPDDQRFAVRITGMPEIWTVAAATGPIVALTPPREGGGLSGPFDWANVIRHEYVHTVTLSQTQNRVPHWFTEACAVWQELNERDYNTAQLLAWALHEEELFELDEIDWGFIRPQTPRDRPLAYAQSHWMVEYIVDRWSDQAIVDMLELHEQGVSAVASIEQVLGVSDEQFMSDFRQWAEQDVVSWGLAPRSLDEELAAILAGQAEPESEERLEELLAEHADHPEVLRWQAEQAMDGDDLEAAREAVLRYAEARPVDPWPHRALVQVALELGRDAEALESLQALDESTMDHGRWAHQLAQIHRDQDDLDAAADAITRALHREPYNGTYRELAATIALQAGDNDEALHHMESMALLEPSRAVHQTRLAALYQRLGEVDKAREAAEQALELNPNAPVQRFLE